jgi:hypothetical protein
LAGGGKRYEADEETCGAYDDGRSEPTRGRDHLHLLF